MTKLIASWFGTGLILRNVRGSDVGSGTLASAVAFPIAVWIGTTFGVLVHLIAIVVVVAAGIWAVERLVGTEGDAGWIVVDEVAGSFVATIGLSWWPALVGIAVFRLADIFKATPGVGWAEGRRGSVGVVGDDLVAGLYGLAAGLATAALF